MLCVFCVFHKVFGEVCDRMCKFSTLWNLRKPSVSVKASWAVSTLVMYLFYLSTQVIEENWGRRRRKKRRKKMHYRPHGQLSFRMSPAQSISTIWLVELLFPEWAWVVFLSGLPLTGGIWTGILDAPSGCGAAHISTTRFPESYQVPHAWYSGPMMVHHVHPDLGYGHNLKGKFAP